MRTLFFCAVMSLAFPAAGQNLLDDPSFENGIVPNCALGLLPDTWVAVLGTPDTFTEDCGQSPGAPLDFPPGHFLTLGGAHEGLRFAAASNFADAFGQRLAVPLQPAMPYEIRAQVARSGVTTGFALVDVYLSALPSLTGATLLGTLTVDPVIGAWREGSKSFCSPSDAAEKPYLLIRPRPGASTAYLAMDSFELVMTEGECPEPPPPIEIIPGLGDVSVVVLSLLLVVLGLSVRRRFRPARG